MLRCLDRQARHHDLNAQNCLSGLASRVGGPRFDVLSPVRTDVVQYSFRPALSRQGRKHENFIHHILRRKLVAVQIFNFRRLNKRPRKETEKRCCERFQHGPSPRTSISGKSRDGSSLQLDLKLAPLGLAPQTGLSRTMPTDLEIKRGKRNEEPSRALRYRVLVAAAVWDRATALSVSFRGPVQFRKIEDLHR